MNSKMYHLITLWIKYQIIIPAQDYSALPATDNMQQTIWYMNINLFLSVLSNKCPLLLSFTLFIYYVPLLPNTTKSRRSSLNTGAKRPHPTTEIVIKPCPVPKNYGNILIMTYYSSSLLFCLGEEVAKCSGHCGPTYQLKQSLSPF